MTMLNRWHMVTVITVDGATRECKTQFPHIAIQALVKDPTDVVSVSVLNIVEQSKPPTERTRP